MQALVLNPSSLPSLIFGHKIFLVEEEFRFWNTDAGTEYQQGHSSVKRSHKVPEEYILHQVSSYQNGMLTCSEYIAHPKHITLFGYRSHIVAVDGQFSRPEYNALQMVLLPPNNAWNTFNAFGSPYGQKTVQRWMDFDLSQTAISVVERVRPDGFVIEVVGEQWSLYHDYVLFRFQQFFNCKMKVLGDSARSFTVESPLANWGSTNRTKADIKTIEQDFSSKNKELYKQFFMSYDRPDLANRAEYYLTKMDKLLTAIVRKEKITGELSVKEQQLAADFVKAI